MQELLDKLVDQGGVWGVLVVVLFYAIYRLFRAYQEIQQARVEEARKTIELLLEIERQWREETRQLLGGDEVDEEGGTP